MYYAELGKVKVEKAMALALPVPLPEIILYDCAPAL